MWPVAAPSADDQSCRSGNSQDWEREGPGQGRDSGERSERTLDAPERSRTIDSGATEQRGQSEARLDIILPNPGC
jgi:hypothetical protein